MARTRKRLALATTAWLVIAGMGPGRAPAEDEVPTPGGRRAAVAKAHGLRARIGTLEDQGAKDAAEAEFRKVVLGSRESFAEVAASVGDKARYVRVALNTRGGGFDAVRFRVPAAGRTYQLFWAFIVPGPIKTQNLGALNILGVDGDELILTYPEVKEDVTVPGMDLPRPNWWSHYRLYGRKLQAGQDYLLWFDLKADQPLPLLMRVWIEPIEPAEPPRTPALQAARGAFQAALGKLNERYDDAARAVRRKYLEELDRANRAASKQNPASRRQEFAAEADRVNLGDSAGGDPRGFRVLRAEIGADDRWNDVTVPIRGLIREDRLEFDPVKFDFKPDAAAGVGKTLIIVYAIDGKPGVYTAPADRKVDIPPRPAATTPARK